MDINTVLYYMMEELLNHPLYKNIQNNDKLRISVKTEELFGIFIRQSFKFADWQEMRNKFYDWWICKYCKQKVGNDQIIFIGYHHDNCYHFNCKTKL